MARFWIERGYLTGYNRTFAPAEMRPRRTAPGWIYFVEVSGFIFRFDSLSDLQAYRDWFAAKLRPSTMRSDDASLSHYERQTGFSRLPARLTRAHNRERVVKTLDAALKHFGNKTARKLDFGVRSRPRNPLIPG